MRSANNTCRFQAEKSMSLTLEEWKEQEELNHEFLSIHQIGKLDQTKVFCTISTNILQRDMFYQIR